MVEAADIFDSAKACLNRAEHHFADFKREAGAFLSRKPYKIITEVDPKTRDHFLKIVGTERMPAILSSLAKDGFTNLRDSLDHAAYACAVASGNTRLKGTYYPIAESEEALRRDVIGRGRCKDIPDHMVEFFIGQKPYKGGNDLIWIVNYIANTKKHRLLIPMTTAANNVMVHMPDRMIMGKRGGTLFPSDKWDSEKNEFIVFRISGDTKMTGNLSAEFTPAITFDVPPISSKYDFHDLTGLFGRIIGEIEAEARGTGLVA